MSRPYPLYDYLAQRVAARTEKTINVKQICATITNISQTSSPEEARKHYEELGALILHHEFIHNGGVLLSPVPFEGKIMVGGKGILHYMMNLPPSLQQILAQYIEENSFATMAMSSSIAASSGSS